MDEDVSHIMLEHLKHLRKGQDAMKDDLRDLKFRVGSLERSFLGVQETLAHHNSRFDRIMDDLDIIKKRLELVEA